MRPVFICLHGPSLKNLEPRIGKLYGEKKIATWTTLNRFPILEKKLGILFDAVYCSSPARMEELLPDVIALLKRGGKFVTNSEIAGKHAPSFKEARKERPSIDWYISDLAFEPGVWHNSLTAFLLFLADKGFKEIYLFGCDGGTFEDNDPIYYGEELIDPSKENFVAREQSIPRDTKLMNEEFWGLFEKYEVKNKPEIINVTDRSHVTCFKTMTWKEFDAKIHAPSS